MPQNDQPDKRGGWLSAAALVVSLVALGASLRAAANRRPTPVGPPVPAPARAASATLEGRLRDVEAAQQEMRRQLEQWATAQPATPPPGPATLEEIRRQLEALAAQQEELARATRGADPYGVIPALEQELVAAYQTLLDEDQPAKARLAQVKTLRRYGHFDERAQQAMLNLLVRTVDRNEQSGILAALAGGITTPAFRDQVLVGLEADLREGGASPRYRYHAIEALEPMLPDPLVQQWLTHLAGADPEWKIAARAAEPLGLPPPPKPALEPRR